MVEESRSYVEMAQKSQQQGLEMIERLISVAQPDSVFGPAATHGEYTLITASEVWAGMGYGFGMGGGTPDEQKTTIEVPAQGETSEMERAEGGGGGGGGGSAARPVAVVTIGPDGVRVEPVVDATKLGLAFFTALGSMFFMLTRMRRSSRG